MKPFFHVIVPLALAASLRASDLLVPTLVGEWRAGGLPAAGEVVAEPEPGQFYLFFEKAAAPGPGANGQGGAAPGPGVTRVYHSRDRNDFGVGEANADALRLVALLPVVGARVARHEGRWFIAGREPGSGEARVAQLEWRVAPAPVPGGGGQGGKGIRVALYDDAGSAGRGVPAVFEQLGRCPDIEVVKLDAEGIRAGLSGHDVVIFTGGSGSRQANAIGLLGREQVRRFVEAGGGYVGICAGAYLACEGFAWGVKVLDARTPSPKWQRGIADLEWEATGVGRETFGLPARGTVRYANGPVLVPAGNPAIPDYEPLVYFRTETARNGSPVGAQVGTPAIARGAYGRGRVIACSPHPEQTAGMEGWIERAVRAVAPRR